MELSKEEISVLFNRAKKAMEIVKALADCDGPEDSEYGICLLCAAPLAHVDDCPWKMAKDWVNNGN